MPLSRSNGLQNLKRANDRRRGEANMNKPMPKADEPAREFFYSMVPDDPRVTVRPMFGNLAAFVNGNMFFCLLGADIAVRLPEAEREVLLREDGAAQFAPMPDRPMREYVGMPGDWRDEPDRIREWVSRSLSWASEMPKKEPKPRKRKAKS
jgi:TfoX/Sxy family transcriptional regulator of competence genes